MVKSSLLDPLTQEELVANVLLFLFAGHETTTNLLGNGVHAMLRDRDGFRLLLQINPVTARVHVVEMEREAAP